MRALTLTPTAMAAPTVFLRRADGRNNRVFIRATAAPSGSAAISGGGVKALEVVEIRDRCKKWQWKGQYSINYLAMSSPEEPSPESQTVVLVHGFGASIPHWRRNISVLSRSHTVYAIDLLGFGASDKPPGFMYTMEAWAELILDFVEEVVQRPSVLIGNSVGSLACLIAASGVVPITS